MRKITDIYEEYKIMPQLQMHQLRVASVAQMICDNINLELDKNIIIKTALLHDMGNIIKFDLPLFPKFLEPEGLEYWESVKSDYIQTYGDNEHEATVKIIEELGVEQEVSRIAGENRFSNMCLHKEGQDIYLKIIHYADGRVGPNGVLSYNERMDDAGERYKDHRINIWQKEERLKLVECGKDIEKQIFFHLNIKPEDINDQSVAPIIENLKNFEI